MKNLLNAFIFCLMIILQNCSSKNENTFVGFDKKSWIDDHNNCREYRLSVIDTIVAQRDKIYQMREVNLKKILGTPDEMDLNTRSQKTFHYKTKINHTLAYCSDQKKYNTLTIELDALGRVSLVYLLPN